MRTLSFPIGLACLALAQGVTLALAPAASASQLDIKPGQWQMTSVMHVEGLGLTIPADALARMPAQTQAEVQAMMQALTQPHTSKSCISDAELQRGFNLNHKMDDKCHQTLANLTSSQMEVSSQCQTDDGSATMDAKFAAPDASTLHGTIEVKRVSAKGPKHMTVQIDGKWLALACDGTEDSPGAVTEK